MLDQLETRFGADTFHMPFDVASGYQQEGGVLVAYTLGGKTVVGPSKGVTGEVYVGFSCGYGSPGGGERIHYVDQAIPSGTDPATGDPVANEIYVPGLSLTRAVLTIGGTDATQAAAGAAPAAGEFAFNGNFVIFNAADAAKVVKGYVVSPQVGDEVFNGGIGLGGNVSVIGTGTVSTDQFDPDGSYVAADGAKPVPLFTAPNGKLTSVNTGTALPKVEVVLPPELNDGFIKVRLL